MGFGNLCSIEGQSGDWNTISSSPNRNPVLGEVCEGAHLLEFDPWPKSESLHTALLLVPKLKSKQGLLSNCGVSVGISFKCLKMEIQSTLEYIKHQTKYGKGCLQSLSQVMACSHGSISAGSLPAPTNYPQVLAVPKTASRQILPG